MRSNYKKIGDFIEQVDKKNNNLSVKTLLGVSIDKKFIPSVANINGVDLSIYKIIQKDQFACKLMSVGRDKQLPVDILRNYQEAIVSPAYYVFKSLNIDVLNPEYLMMWLSRKETDRWVGYISGGDVRGGISWDQFCEMPIIVPSIEKQQEIVREYNVISESIKLNENFNQKLEEAVQAIYKHWFVDFEFPIQKKYAEEIGKPKLEGKPYKSSGMNMVWNDELEVEMPEHWKCSRLDEFALISAGGDRPKVFSDYKSKDCPIPIYSNSTDNEGLYGFTNKPKVKQNSITVSARGAIIGYTVLRLKPFVPIIRLVVIKPKSEFFLNYLFESVKKFRYNNEASAQGQLTVPDISSFKLANPGQEILLRFQNLTFRIIEIIEVNKSQNRNLRELLKVLHSKMSKV